MQITAPLNSEAAPELQWIEVASSLQIPGFQIIGLPAPEVAEARERVKAAIETSGFEFPRRRVVINLSPASVRKRGTGLDLAIALAVIQSDTNRKPPLEKIAAWGELGLDGSIKPAGQLTRAIYACWQAGIPLLLVCTSETEEARQTLALLARSELLPGPPPRILGAACLAEAWELLSSPPAGAQAETEGSPPASASTRDPSLDPSPLLPLAPSLERAVAVSAAGVHHMLLLGPRGAGKSHALEWLVALQPPMDAKTRVAHSLLAELSLSRAGSASSATEGVPVRRISPHCRPSALIGGASSGSLRPGEFTLAHGGLLIADEFPEWSRDSREALREPMERGAVTLTRARGAQELPARFMLAANGNLCPCGGWPPQFPLPSEARETRVPRCRCSHTARDLYRARLSGPVLDRLDLVVLAAPAGGRGRRRTKKVFSGAEVALRLKEELRMKVLAARDRAIRDWGTPPGLLEAVTVERILSAHPDWREPLERSGNLSLRGRHKVARVALTLAAWDECAPTEAHFAEAAFYRPERYGLSG